MRLRLNDKFKFGIPHVIGYPHTSCMNFGECWGDIIPNNNHKPPKGVPRCIVASFFFFLLKKILKEKKKKK